METLVSLISTVKSILDELGGYFSDSNLLIYVSMAVMAITLITHLIFRKIRPIKYLPGLIVLLIGIFNFYEVMYNITAESSLPNLLLFIVGVVSGLMGMFFALIIGIIVKPVKRNRRTTKKPVPSNTENENNKKLPYQE
ncbi:MAG: hypothetical protein RBR71_03930 [Gudongella sp.]|nr:hypothetical protein [Gudongella sp.]